MPLADRTFGSALIQFAKSVDHVGNDTFRRVGDQIIKYVGSQLDTDFFEFKEATVDDDGVAGLRKVWWSDQKQGENPVTQSLLRDEGDLTSYRNQTSFAYGSGRRGRKLWIVSRDQGVLSGKSGHVDTWSPDEQEDGPEIPPYQQPEKRDLMTSIIVPVNRGDTRVGIINLESKSYIESNSVAKRELLLLADAIGLLYFARNATNEQTASTASALVELDRILDGQELQPLTKPQIFVAYSARADEDVVARIQEVLGQFQTHLAPLRWDELKDPGNVTEQVLNEIGRSRFGLCYLSEPTDAGAEFKFRDNANVIFEAGMLHKADPSGWIPIRELASPPTPFDFQQQRTVTPLRTEAGELDAVNFVAELQTTVLGMLRSEA